jgi:hypothetical protein
MPGAVALAGWPAFQWRQLGRGAAPASFKALEQIRVGMWVIVPFFASFMYYVEWCEVRPPQNSS